MSAVVEFISDAVETVVDAVGDVVEAVGDFVSDAVETVGNVIEAVIEDPLPVLLSVAGSFVGIPPMVTSAAITAARGGDLEDIVLSAGTAYFAPTATNAISSTLSSTIGDAIINETVSNVVVDGISKGLVNGVVSEVKGGDFDDGFAGAFTGTVVGAGVTEVSNFVSENVLAEIPDFGAVGDIAQKAVTSGVTAELTGKGDFDRAFTNSLINQSANLGANYISSSIDSQFKATELAEIEIVGDEEGDKKDKEIVTKELDDTWAQTQGIRGTGAGIPDEIVDQVEVSDLGYESPNVNEDPMIVEEMQADQAADEYTSPDMTLEAEADLTAPVEDVSDIQAEYGDEEQQPQMSAYDQVMEQYGVPEQPSVEAQQPVGGLGAVSEQQAVEQAPDRQMAQPSIPLQDVAPREVQDVLKQITNIGISPVDESKTIDISGAAKSGLASFLPKGLVGKDGQINHNTVLAGALNQILKPAINKGLTKTLIGEPQRPQRPAPRPAPPPRPVPTQVAQAPVKKPVPKPPVQTVSVAPPAPKPVDPNAPPPKKKKDVKKLTPVENVAGLTSLLNSKG